MKLSRKIFIDSCAFVALIIKGHQFHKNVETFFIDIVGRDCVLFASPLVFGEIVMGMYKALKKKEDEPFNSFSEKYDYVMEQMIELGVEILPVGIEGYGFLSDIVEGIRENNLRPYDSIHIATARNYGITELVTTDKKLNRIDDPKIINLGD